MVIASDTLIVDVNDAKKIIGKKIADKIMIFI
jgi:Fe2+ transport system protein FeoA